MKKIPTLFQRNYDGNRLVRDEVTPGCEWVIQGEGVATIKWDGTSCLIIDGQLYKRYDAKKGKQPPANFISAQDEPDPITGHWPGWVYVDFSLSENCWHKEAWEKHYPSEETLLPCIPLDWTYELIGPRVQSNPYGLKIHRLIRHGTDEVVEVPRDFEELRDKLTSYRVEGIVWWRDRNDLDCDKVKLKRRDFGLQWPVRY